MKDTRKLVVSAVTAALYAGLTIALAPISYGAIQFRVAEALCVLPFLIPETALGLFVGCLLANLMTGNVVDIIFGSLATLLAGVITSKMKRPWQACLPPILCNAMIVGAVLSEAYGIGNFWICAGQVGLSEALVMFILGLPLLMWLSKKENLYK